MNYEGERTGFFHRKINCDEEGAQHLTWPKVKLCVFFDVSYNLGDVSERIIELCDKYRERYVGCETASFVTASSPTKNYGLKKNRRKAMGRSPRRYSYQTHRRKIFSSNSLKEACKTNAFGITKKTILLPKFPVQNSLTKSESKETKRALFLSAEERSKSQSKILKQSPSKLKSMEIRRSLWLQRKLSKKGNTPCKMTPKKSLTPRKQTPRKNSVMTPKKMSGRPTPRKLTPSKHYTPKKTGTPKRMNVYGITNENSKRKRSELDSCGDTSITTRLTVDSVSLSSDDSRLESNVSSLSDSQRRKLLWAVSASLKQVGVGSTHQNFRIYCRKLFKKCKLVWTSCASNATIRQGVSDRMLLLANEYVNSVISEVQQAHAENVDLWSQDSNSCDFFLTNEERKC